MQVVLGLPIVPSIGNLDFWLRLCNVRGLPEAQDLLRSFPQSEDRDQAGHAAAVRQWNADLIQKVTTLRWLRSLKARSVIRLTTARACSRWPFLAFPACMSCRSQSQRER